MTLRRGIIESVKLCMNVKHPFFIRMPCRIFIDIPVEMFRYLTIKYPEDMKTLAVMNDC